jgi:hypothetical protein
MMSDDTKPSVEKRDEEDPFLIPPGQPGSYVDQSAAAQDWLPGLEPREVEVQFVKVVIRKGARRDD